MTVEQAAQVLGTSAQFVRRGIETERLPIGTCAKIGAKGRNTYLIVPTKLARYMAISMEELADRTNIPIEKLERRIVVEEVD